MSSRWMVLAGNMLLLPCSAPSRAHADESLEHSTPPHEERARSAAAMTGREYWSGGRLCPFAAAVLDADVSARGRLLLGYGAPHWTWGGLELEAGRRAAVGAMGE